MATYKVLQDIESEDKLVGPFSLRQFIYAAIVVVLGFIAYQLGRVNIFLTVPFLPPMIFFGALAAPIGGAQSTEVWLLAKVRFFLKPRRRIWNQDGIQQLVTVTAPKKAEKQLTDNLSQTEVKSRLSALANTLDSRGWAVRGAINQTPIQVTSTAVDDDRLLAVDASTPNPIDNTEDVMDETSGRVALAMQSLLNQSSQQHRQQIMDKVKKQDKPGQPADYWFMSNRPGDPKGATVETVLPGLPDKSAVDDKGQAEQAFLQKRHREVDQPNPYNSHLKTLQPLDPHGSKKPQQDTYNANVARLANNDDLNISTIAREAKRNQDNDDGEVVVNLR